MSWIAKLIGRRERQNPAAQAEEVRRKTEALANIRVVIDHQEYTPDDLTLRTFRISPYEGQLIARQKFLFDFIITRPEEEEPVRFTGHGYVKTMDVQSLEAIFRQPQPYYQQMLIDLLGLAVPVGRSSHAA